MGGRNQNHKPLTSTETLRYVNKRWEISSGPSLPEASRWSAAAVASRSNDIVGYLVGGVEKGGVTSKILALRRRDGKFVKIRQRLQIRRWGHTVVNVHSNEIPSC